MNQHTQPAVNYLKDYHVPDFKIESIDLQFELYEDKTIVHSVLKVCRNSTQGRHTRPLVLQGEELKLLSIQRDDNLLTPNDYTIESNQLILNDVPDIFTLGIVTEIYPQKNTALSGLYRTENLFCTQCEPEGFRRITYYLDRPDVMAPFTVTIFADKTHYPVLLSNGNKIATGELPDNRHWVKWHDPFKKPSYLFALVAGKLAKISDTYSTSLSGRKIALEIFVDPENAHKCQQAIDSLKNAMRWDEEYYGREYDLDVYMIVAVNDFNMGAMENKGLNIFNAKYVLADQKTATDMDFQSIEAVVGHEYFHNWTGNRITCRDWFQLSLKEGLTVFREQEFAGAMGSAAVKRIQYVKHIRTRQFAEDAGPMAHPVRPESYIEINNFYTSTIYNKGAEVIRMLYTLLGKEKFRKGMDCYFERHDGQAVTIEDFIASFEDANKVDLKQFYRWYNQAGTPIVQAKGKYDASKHQFVLTLSQSCPPTPDKKEKKPFVIPVKMALYNKKGERLPQTGENHFLLLDKESQDYIFDNISEAPVPSLLGDFSAPVKLDYPYTSDELLLLMTHDNDLFNRWDSAQQISLQVIEQLISAYRDKRTLDVPHSYLSAFKFLLENNISDAAFLAQLLSLPSFNYIAETKSVIDIEPILAARKALGLAFSKTLKESLVKLYDDSHKKDDGTLHAESMGYRALKNVCLSYLVLEGSNDGLEYAQKQYKQARNMTDRIGVLAALNLSHSPIRKDIFEDFYQQWKKDPLVVNKWLALQAMCELPGTLEAMNHLLSHEAFDLANPNKVYSLINTFGASNPTIFHDNQGRGYDFVAKQVVELNQRNPQVAARLLENLTQWKRLDEAHGQMMKKALIFIQESGSLSENVYEVVTKSLMG